MLAAFLACREGGLGRDQGGVVTCHALIPKPGAYIYLLCVTTAAFTSLPSHILSGRVRVSY